MMSDDILSRYVVRNNKTITNMETAMLRFSNSVFQVVILYSEIQVAWLSSIHEISSATTFFNFHYPNTDFYNKNTISQSTIIHIDSRSLTDVLRVLLTSLILTILLSIYEIEVDNYESNSVKLLIEDTYVYVNVAVYIFGGAKNKNKK